MTHYIEEKRGLMSIKNKQKQQKSEDSIVDGHFTAEIVVIELCCDDGNRNKALDLE